MYRILLLYPLIPCQWHSDDGCYLQTLCCGRRWCLCLSTFSNDAGTHNKTLFFARIFLDTCHELLGYTLQWIVVLAMQ